MGGRAFLTALVSVCLYTGGASSSCEHGKERAARALVAAAWATDAPLQSQALVRMAASYYAQDMLRAECDSTDEMHNSMLVDTLVGLGGVQTAAEARRWAYISFMQNMASMIPDGPSRGEATRGATPESTSWTGTARGIQFPASAGPCRPWAVESAICVAGCSATELYTMTDSNRGAMIDAVVDGVITSVPAVVTHNLELAVPIQSLPEDSVVKLSARGCYSSGGTVQVSKNSSIAYGCEGKGLASFFYDVINGCSTTLEDGGEMALLQSALALAHDDMKMCDLLDIKRTNVLPADVATVATRIVRHKDLHRKASSRTYWALISGLTITAVVACIAALPSKI